jgi:hypothetical protein
MHMPDFGYDQMLGRRRNRVRTKQAARLLGGSLLA